MWGENCLANNLWWSRGDYYAFLVLLGPKLRALIVSVLSRMFGTYGDDSEK